MRAVPPHPFHRSTRAAAALALGLALAGCGEDGPFSRAGSPDAQGAEVASAPGRLVERDVEAPEIFQVTEAGLWDGRPSLGGVWVAHPDVEEPERVIVRNRENGSSVVAALFRRERDNPGPALQVSSEAAEELGLLAGAPAQLNVTALRREEVAPETRDMEAQPTSDLAAPTEIAATALDPLAGAEAAIDAAEAAPPATAAPPTPAAASDLARPFIQVGIFSVEANAQGAAERMRATGIVPTLRAQESQGSRFWRVLVGPAGTEAERAALLDKVTAEGFTDAYFVSD